MSGTMYFLVILCLIHYSEPRMYKISTEYQAQSYNYRQRFLVLHYTACDLKKSLEILTGNRVSSHYVVPEGAINNERRIYQLVPEELRAWTQGVSYWRGRTNLNDQGIGVEIVNLGFTFDGSGGKIWYRFQPYQIESVIHLSKDIIKRYDIEPRNVIGHADCAPGRKVDPGPYFPWKQLYDNGIGAWPDDDDVVLYKQQLSDDQINLKEFQEDLSKYGYKVNTDGRSTDETRNAVQSFQMHFRQTKFDGVVDKETWAVLKALLKKYY